MEDPKAIAAYLESMRAINPDTGCWLWTGSVNNQGRGPTHEYGSISIEGRQRLVHRVSAMVYLGFDISSPLSICHSCDTPLCFNPKHLFVGSQVENMQDMIRKGRRVLFYGEQSGHNKLTEAEVLELRHLYDAGHSRAALARRFGIGIGTVFRIGTRQSWKHL